MTRTIKKNDPCLCGSHKSFIKCCGKTNEMGNWKVEEGLKPENSYFILSDIEATKFVCNADGKILVWRNSKTCAAYGVRNSNHEDFTIHGLSEEQWKEFIAIAPYIITEDQN